MGSREKEKKKITFGLYVRPEIAKQFRRIALESDRTIGQLFEETVSRMEPPKERKTA